MWRFVIDAFYIARDLIALLLAERWDRHKIHAYQDRKLIRQLRYAVTEISYYRALGIDREAIVDAKALEEFPILSKKIIQSQKERLCSPAEMARHPRQSVTSGSSSEPTTTWFDSRSWIFCKYALKIWRTLIAGVPWRQRLVIFDETAKADSSIAAPKSQNYLLFRQTRMSVFTPIEQQIEVLMAWKPTAIYGSPSGVKELCDYALRNELEFPAVPTIFLAAELISDTVRQQIETQFDGRVVGVYGSTEFKDIAHECEHRRYHINFQSVFVEARSEPGHATPKLLITSLVNKAMPLIRFDIGDYATLGFDACACGRESPYLTNIAGRQAEFLHLADGRCISPYQLTTAVETTPGLVRYQFVQHDGLALEMRVIFTGSADEVAASKALLQQRLRTALGPGIDVSIVSVEAIERTAAGKHQIVTRPD